MVLDKTGTVAVAAAVELRSEHPPASVIASVNMALSSVSVVSSSQRLRRIRI